MKQKTQKIKRQLQNLIEQQLQLKGTVDQIQRQIDDMEAQYLQSSWLEGNIYMGWNKHLSSTSLPNNNRIVIDPKQKIFSLSSLQSPSFAQLSTVDRHLMPYGQSRFQSKKKKRIKKRTSSQMRRPRPIRKKRRR